MALKRKGKYSYGDGQMDIRAELLRYSKLNGYLAAHFADAVCACGGRIFRLFVDDVEGAAVRKCEACKTKHPIGDSAEFLSGASLSKCECVCGAYSFEITVGLALYEDSEDVRWIYVGCRCPACHLMGSYGDWKNEFEGYQKLLGMI